MLKELLSSKTKQRLILAARAVDKSRQRSRESILEEAAVLDDPRATLVEMCTATVAAMGHKVVEIPNALIAGAEELVKKR